jgi:hypothetical protein
MWNLSRNPNNRTGTPLHIVISLSIAVLAAVPPCTSAEVNLFTPEMQKIKETYLSEFAQHGVSRTNAVAKFLDRHIEKYDQDLTQHKRTGNVTKMGIARTAGRALAKMKQGLDAAKPISMPARVRRELKTEFAAIGEELKALQATHAGTASAARKTLFDQFVEACRAQQKSLPPGNELEDLFNNLLSTKTPDPKPPEPGDGTQPAPMDVVAEVPAVLSMSGPSTEWAGVGFLQVEANAIDLFEIKIGGIREPTESGGEHMMNNEPYIIRYEPVRVFEPVEMSQFQIKSVPGKLPLEILEWPDAKNEWTLSFRVRPGDEIPSKHVVELMAGYEGVSSLAMIEGSQSNEADDEEPADTPVETRKVMLTVKSDPESAGVFLDGRRVRINKRGSRTPCSFEILAGTYDVVIRKYGFNDVFIKQLDVREDTTIVREMEINENIVNETVTISPKQTWRNSRVKVVKGEEFALSVKGRWACGGGGEFVDAAGYPNNRKFFKYYANAEKHPRQVTTANYGALLMRIGGNGKISKTDNSLRERATAAGYIYFDINESVLRSHRADNIGALTVNIRKFGTPPR